MAKLRILLAGAAFAVGISAAGWSPDSSSSMSPQTSLAKTAPEGGLAEAAFDDAEVSEGTAPSPIVTAAATPETLAVTRLAVGWIEPTASVDVQPHIRGKIVELWAIEGQTVAAGDPLFRLDDREIRARIARSNAILARDRAKLVRAMADLEIQKKLGNRGAVSPSQLHRSAAEVEILAAEAAASEASLLLDTIALDHATVRAPIDGRIGAIGVSRGSFVGPPEAALGDPPITITRIQPVAVSFSLPDRDLDLLRASLEGDERDRVQVFSSGSDERFGAGPISFMDSAIDPKSGTVLVRALLANEDGRLWPGQYVRVSVDLGPQREVVTVPVAAVMHGENGPSVFVARQDGKVERRLVELGEARGERAVIEEGLMPHELIVVEGQWGLHDGASVSMEADAPINVADRAADSGGRGRQ